MAKEITYSEPQSYFNADMKKAAKEWEKAQAQKAKEQSAPKKKGK